ncbi:MAG TPA: NAD+ synthase [Candidatus Krumholzibacteria bacterium]|nr:NAD+ synthase [Candidatus Krumholzibacteria bacterium]
MRIALVQLNTVVGDVDGNVSRMLGAVERARAQQANLVVFQELGVSGYPPRDLVERASFIRQCEAGLGRLCGESRAWPSVGVIAGLPMASHSAVGKGITNSAVAILDGNVIHRHDKLLLPTYDVFDEARYFDAAESCAPFEFGGQRIGLSICEDAWNDPLLFRRRPYSVDPIAMLAAGGARLMINISASPFTVGKEAFRAELMGSHSRRHRCPFVFVNQVGGNDELVFDGCSLVTDAHGHVHMALAAFAEDLRIFDTEAPGARARYTPLDEIESMRRALVLGVRDYFGKCGFTRAVVGLSGGIDSAVTLALAAEALGPGNVLGVAMPSPFSSTGSIEDSQALATNLGVELMTIPIAHVMAAYDSALSPAFQNRPRDVTEENLQARIRGNLLMAVSNKFGHLVLSTGNKSELAVGYCTLYGDMSGGLALISDVPKTSVYRLAALINRDREVIPRTTIDKVPSAELRPDQKDSDSLPPYEVLDPILDLHLEEGCSADEIVARGYDRATVEWVVRAVRVNEYKRRQAAPGLKITSKAFGVGRRFPVAARYTL